MKLYPVLNDNEIVICENDYAVTYNVMDNNLIEDNVSKYHTLDTMLIQKNNMEIS